MKAPMFINLVILPLMSAGIYCLHQHPHHHSSKNQTHNNRQTLNQSTPDASAKLNEVKAAQSLTKCSSAEQELDRCSAQLIALGRAGLYPGNLDELESVYCPNFNKIVSCINENSQCYKPFERQIISWVLSSTRRLNYKRCRNDGEKAKFLRLTSSCLVAMSSPMDTCMSTYISNLEAIADLNKSVERLSEDDIQIQLSCCANRQFKNCVMTSAKQACRFADTQAKLQRTNSVSSRRVLERYIDRMSSNMVEDLRATLDKMSLTGPEFICQTVDEKFCSSRFTGRFRGRSARHKSIIPAMIRIYSNQPLE